MRLSPIGDHDSMDRPSTRAERWSNYVREIDFHVEIIGYHSNSFVLIDAFERMGF